MRRETQWDWKERRPQGPFSFAVPKKLQNPWYKTQGALPHEKPGSREEEVQSYRFSMGRLNWAHRTAGLKRGMHRMFHRA